LKPATEHTERYTAVDEDGVEHLIDVYTDMIEVPSFGSQCVPALNSHKMSATGAGERRERWNTVNVATGRKNASQVTGMSYLDRILNEGKPRANAINRIRPSRRCGPPAH
jgi:hypothetical protein